MSNVDNLGATLDPAIIGAHLEANEASGAKITAEVVAKEPGDKGGAPARVAVEVADDLPIKEARDRWVAPMEREYLMRIVKRSGGDLDKAAEEAGIHRKSLERLLRQHGLKAADFRD